MKALKILLICMFVTYPTTSKGCTIFSAIGKNGHVWVGNNEDDAFGFYNYINVFPKKRNTKYGYFTLSYNTPENGENFNIQGGMNEAGLFYDFNTLTEGNEEYIISDLHKKKSFPGGDQAILSHILANFSTAKEVVDFFNEYWFDIGFKGAQMHVADRNGQFAIIDPTGSRLLTDKPYQLSTNFSICANESSATCWRFPIAEEILKTEAIGLSSFIKISEKTSQKGDIGTIYTNIQNLSTGDITLFFGLDYVNSYSTNIKELLRDGRKSYLIKDLFPENILTQTYDIYQKVGSEKALEFFNTMDLNEDVRNTYLAAFVNNEIGKRFDLNAIPFLDEYLKSDPIGHWMTGSKAISYFNDGKISDAINVIKSYQAKYPETSMNVSYILDRFDGKFPTEYNTVIKLLGHKNAKNVFVKGLTGGVYDFMSKTEDGWIFKNSLPDDIYNYSFVVDGIEVLDSKTKVYSVKNPFSQDVDKSHRVAINKSIDAYKTKIRVNVPNIKDEVYITGNQANLANWNAVFKMKRISDFERELTVKLHYPTMIKFNRGNWSSEAIVDGYPKNEKQGSYPPIEFKENPKQAAFKILGWKDDSIE